MLVIVLDELDIKMQLDFFYSVLFVWEPPSRVDILEFAIIVYLARVHIAKSPPVSIPTWYLSAICIISVVYAGTVWQDKEQAENQPRDHCAWGQRSRVQMVETWKYRNCLFCPRYKLTVKQCNIYWLIVCVRSLAFY